MLTSAMTVYGLLLARFRSDYRRDFRFFFGGGTEIFRSKALAFNCCLILLSKTTRKNIFAFAGKCSGVLSIAPIPSPVNLAYADESSFLDFVLTGFHCVHCVLENQQQLLETMIMGTDGTMVLDRECVSHIALSYGSRGISI